MSSPRCPIRKRRSTISSGAETRRRTHPGQPYRRRERPAPPLRTGVRAIGAAARLAAGVSVGTIGRLGRETWRRHLGRAPTDAADGTFFADPLPQILTCGCSARNQRAPRPFSVDGYQTLASYRLRADGLVRSRGGAVAADAGNAAGQTAPPAAADNCSPTQPVPPRGTIAPEGSTTGQSAEPLGDRLAKSDGVLCPPAGVDPEIRAPTPDTGNTPVIRLRAAPAAIPACGRNNRRVQALASTGT